jgi:tripartite-type tricarboxylate transporter receptor subunit TctC
MALALSVLGAPAGVQAQAYPTKPIRLVVPVAPGGTLDFFARITAGPLKEILGQPVVVENRPGANFTIGTEAVTKADPDGHTLLVAPSTIITINPLAFPNQQPLRDLVPVTLGTQNVFVLIVNSGLPVSSVEQLLAQLRANPGKMNHASNSYSTMLMSELMKAMAKVDYADVNYKGAAPAAASTAAGETQFCFVDLGSAITPIRSGRVRVLAVTTPQRYRLQPETPTLSEAGMPGYTYVAWTVVLAPIGTPAPVVARINAAFRQVLAMPEVAARIEDTKSEVVGSSVEAALQELRADAERWARLVKERDIKFQ